MADGLREATLDDLPVLLSLDRQIFGPAAYTDNQWRSDLGDAARRTFIAAPARGFITLQNSGDDQEVIKIGVVSEARRQGIARALLEKSTDKSKRCIIDVSDANTAAITFYTALGFREIARRRNYYADGSDAVVMEREQTASGA